MPLFNEINEIIEQEWIELELQKQAISETQSNIPQKFLFKYLEQMRKRNGSNVLFYAARFVTPNDLSHTPFTSIDSNDTRGFMQAIGSLSQNGESNGEDFKERNDVVRLMRSI